MRRTPFGLVLAVVTGFVWVTPPVGVTPIVSGQAGFGSTGPTSTKLEVAWRFKTDNLGRRPDTSSKGRLSWWISDWRIPWDIIVAVSGGAYSGEYIAFNLPTEMRPTNQGGQD